MGSNLSQVCCIITHYGAPDLSSTLASLENVRPFEKRILVINNDVRTTLLDLKAQFPKVEFINSPTNGGYAGGMNQGLKTALEGSSSFFWLLGQDLTFEPNTLEIMLNLWPKLEHPGFLGALTDYNDTSKIYFAKATFGKRGKSKHLFENQNIEDVAELNAEFGTTDYVNGACLLTSREVLEKVGLLPECYFLYFEDAEWGLSATRCGFKNYVSFRARVHHHRPNPERNWTAEYYCRRNDYLFKKRNGFVGKTAKYSAALGLVRKWLKSSLKSALSSSIERKKKPRCSRKFLVTS